MPQQHAQVLEETAAYLRSQLARVGEASIAGRRLFQGLSLMAVGLAELEEAEEERAAADHAVT